MAEHSELAEMLQGDMAGGCRKVLAWFALCCPSWFEDEETLDVRIKNHKWKGRKIKKFCNKLEQYVNMAERFPGWYLPTIKISEV